MVIANDERVVRDGVRLMAETQPDLAVIATAAGDGALSPRVAGRLIRSYAAHRQADRIDPAALERLATLTDREREVLTLIGEGLSKAEIAAHLVVSEHTVKSHVSRLLAETGCRDRAQAAVLARRITN
ncbi:response regulator transcription factor [Streptomyces sp. NPDC086549]|uniref:response regulator transcription factor n=1 Tax=Streptomyces sp. NPDC086549 TaxID=3365752 RepID=UPI0038244178